VLFRSLCAGVGAFGGWQGAVFCLFGGAVVGVITALPGLIQSKVKGEEYAGVVPFVPSMAVAGAIWFFRGPELVHPLEKLDGFVNHSDLSAPSPRPIIEPTPP